MADNEEDWIRKRAYALWEDEGYPNGKHDEHWARAKEEFSAFGSGPASRAPTKRSSTPPAATVAEPVKKPAAKRAKKPTAGS